MLLPATVVAQTTPSKPKTLKELIAEEKAQKEAEKQAKEEEKAAKESKKQSQTTSNDPKQSQTPTSPEDAADIVTETDSAIWAPTHVKQLGAKDYDELTQAVSSLDLNDPSNITTTVEYQPQTGTYIIRTKMGDTDVTTPYMLTQAAHGGNDKCSGTNGEDEDGVQRQELRGLC